MNAYHKANQIRWEHASASWARGAESRGLWRSAYSNSAAVLLAEELAILGDIRGKSVCVLGSGDNQAVFAFAGLGAVVTSVDISQKQLDVARQRAETLRASVKFVCADVSNLKAIAANSFDIVYTGGHVAVWVSELAKYYAEATRILKSGGLFLINEYHPFRRLWRDAAPKLELQYGYFERGPHAHDYTDDILVRKPGSLRCYEFHWTVSDFMTAVLKAGNEIVAVHEVGDENEGWESTPMKGLPQCLVIASRKRNA